MPLSSELLPPPNTYANQKLHTRTQWPSLNPSLKAPMTSQTPRVMQDIAKWIPLRAHASPLHNLHANLNLWSHALTIMSSQHITPKKFLASHVPVYLPFPLHVGNTGCGIVRLLAWLAETMSVKSPTEPGNAHLTEVGERFTFVRGREFRDERCGLIQL
ncbi:hypothetical protein HBH96_059470 [Parastagonospora nodorum]|nr:hypothetical protein HBH96_059470 [Parastagonospora nodorum]KAH5297599.1 hypothetical protein HBI11_158350 [Parastagonospora nodorum]